MKIPRFWKAAEEQAEIRGRTMLLRAWGHSDSGPEEALRMASGRLPSIRQAIESGRKADSYDYFSRGIRELRVQAWETGGREHTVLTRNGYGALVLNTERVMFIDIDVPEGRKVLFFGKGTDERRKERAKQVEEAVKKRACPPVRIYETAGGLRLVALDKTYDPTGAEAGKIMEALGADPLYLRLCRAQQCFRARLTPKPWRIRFPNPPFRFPEAPEASPYKDWLEKYEKAGASYRVCNLLGTAGADPRRSEIEEVLKIHDRHCGMKGSGPLG